MAEITTRFPSASIVAGEAGPGPLAHPTPSNGMGLTQTEQDQLAIAKAATASNGKRGNGGGGENPGKGGIENPKRHALGGGYRSRNVSSYPLDQRRPSYARPTVSSLGGDKSADRTHDGAPSGSTVRAKASTAKGSHAAPARSSEALERAVAPEKGDGVTADAQSAQQRRFSGLYDPSASPADKKISSLGTRTIAVTQHRLGHHSYDLEHSIPPVQHHE